VAQPEVSQRVKVGILLGRQPDDLGEWLADGTAFEAAGADALWVALAPALALDPLSVTAALAAVTFRSVLVSVLPISGEPSPALARTLDTIAKLSHGRLRILAGDTLPDRPVPPDSGRATAASAPLRPPAAAGEAGPALRNLLPAPGGRAPFGRAYAFDEGERWTSAPPPTSRATWRAALRDAAENGFRGLLVPADPRLIDILRNPDDPGQRLDLHLAQG
jgi:hypothetical protein